jgi:hypothetical protein
MRLNERFLVRDEPLKLEVRTLNVESRKGGATFLDSEFSVQRSNFSLFDVAPTDVETSPR